MAAGAAAAERRRRRRRLLGREGGRERRAPRAPPTSPPRPSPRPPPPPPAPDSGGGARTPARTRRTGSGLVARSPTNPRLRPPGAPAGPSALARGRPLARPPAPPRPLSGRSGAGPHAYLRRREPRPPPPPPLLSSPPLPRPHGHQPPPRPPPPPPPPPPHMPSAPRACASHNPPRRTVPFAPPRARGGGGAGGAAAGLPGGPRSPEGRAEARDDSPPRPPRRAAQARLRRPPTGPGGRVRGGPAPLRRQAVGGRGGCAVSRFLPDGPSSPVGCGRRGACGSASAEAWCAPRAGRSRCRGLSAREIAAAMLTRTSRLISGAWRLDPGRLLHAGSQAPQSLATHLDNQAPDDSPRAVSRTSEKDPARHGEQHEGLHYNIPLQDMRTLFPHSLPPRFSTQVKTFTEACLMVRKPALELLHYLKNTNFAHPAVRYVLYGEKGTGKTLSLCHVIHFCAKQDWLILHVPDAHLWVKSCRGLLPSTYNKQRLDQPAEASIWLKNFKTTNERFLSQIKVQEKYVWNKRESTEKGSPLGEVVEQVAPEELALVHNLRKMVKNDWHGGTIVLSLSQTGSLFKPRKAYLPQELLGKEGFDALDPFIPILVSNYSPKEFESCIQYYLENSWLQHEKAHTEEGKKELLFLSNANPGQLERLCAHL
ncbi:28S ribosomal protein S29, mitochondrial isoform X3 [Leopardus geoffroyi]|uniref:28S ribosomal protein S29, mitochondrial isoform X3 n=1 Tax=Leopardus geoffroyi TaxID=46844 RepID=UPI001E262994|nr:28S ribosomal protein S29, mitochondrial isoform X3 [Leopardus geoffroyi]